MVDKEEKEKLTEALKEYIGEDVGDVDYCYGEDLQESGRRITIITKPHKPTFKEKRKELVGQLDKDLKEIDRYLRVTADGTRLYIYFDKNNNWICSLDECMDPLNNLQLYDACLSVTEMSRITNVLSEYCLKTYVLRRRYEDETI